MSDDGTDDPRDPGDEPRAEVPAPDVPAPDAPPPPAPDAPTVGVTPFAVPAPETVDVPDAAAAVDDFEVPPPPTFGAVPPVIAPEPVVPPLPESAIPPSAAPPRAAWSSDSTWSSSSEHRAATNKVAPQAWPTNTPDQFAADGSAHPVPGDTAGNSYRGWTIGIFAGLILLLIAAVIGLFYLFNNVPLELPSSQEKPSTVQVQDEAAEPGDSAGEKPAIDIVPLETCGDLCTRAASDVGAFVTGQGDGVTWDLTDGWHNAEVGTVPAGETAVAEYTSSAGTLKFVIWGFGDDSVAEAAFDDLSAQYGAPDNTGTVFENGAGVRNEYDGGGSTSILWSVIGDGSQPWVMLIDGPEGDATFQFYLSLPI